MTKTHHMIFTLNRHLPPFRPIVMEGVEIEEVTSTKFLGVIIDNRLTWNAHIAYISSKISKIIGIIRKADSSPLFFGTRVLLGRCLWSAGNEKC